MPHLVIVLNHSLTCTRSPAPVVHDIVTIDIGNEILWHLGLGWHRGSAVTVPPADLQVLPAQGTLRRHR